MKYEFFASDVYFRIEAGKIDDGFVIVIVKNSQVIKKLRKKTLRKKTYVMRTVLSSTSYLCSLILRKLTVSSTRTEVGTSGFAVVTTISAWLVLAMRTKITTKNFVNCMASL